MCPDRPPDRLHKILAHAGVASRRKCEEYIRDGRVSVNGKIVTELGTRIDPGRDHVAVDGKAIRLRAQQKRYYALYKPRGYLSTVSDPHGRPTARDLVPSDDRLYPVGRLDLDSEGLLLFTNDGPLAQRLMHPRFEHEKEYLVLVRCVLSPSELDQLRSGVEIERALWVSCQAENLDPHYMWRHAPNPPHCRWVRVVLKQGYKRQIRLMMAAIGHPVVRLIRVRIDTLHIKELEPGEGRWLSEQEVTQLLRSASLGRNTGVKPLPKINIAIDGPAASGKSTVADILSRKLGYIYLDTGVMYRSVTWAALDRGIPIADETAITRLAESLEIQVTAPTNADSRAYTVLADGIDITHKIREPLVNQNVSPVSAYSGVRSALTEQQRRMGAQGGIIMAGRDVGTVVLPDAEVKIYLDATLDQRAIRRHHEQLARGEESSLRQVLADLSRRDQIDSSRKIAPLSIADDAIVIDSTNLTVDQVVAEIEEIARQVLASSQEVR